MVHLVVAFDSVLGMSVRHGHETREGARVRSCIGDELVDMLASRTAGSGKGGCPLWEAGRLQGFHPLPSLRQLIGVECCIVWLIRKSSVVYGYRAGPEASPRDEKAEKETARGDVVHFKGEVINFRDMPSLATHECCTYGLNPRQQDVWFIAKYIKLLQTRGRMGSQIAFTLRS